MKPKWVTFLQAFLITFGAALLVIIGTAYLALYRPRLVEYRSGARLPPAIAAVAETEPESPAETLVEPTAVPATPLADESGIIRAAPAGIERSTVSGRRRQDVNPMLDLPRTGESPPPLTSGAVRQARGRSFTGTHQGVFLSAANQETLEAVRQIAQAVAPDGRRSGLKSLVETGGVLTARLAQPDPENPGPDPAGLLEEALTVLKGTEPGAIRRIEVIQGTETAASRDL